MPTQEERLTALEQTTREYRPVLQNFAYELTMVKGLIVDQIGITQGLKQDMDEIKQHLNTIDTRPDRVDTRLDRVEMLLTEVLACLSPDKHFPEEWFARAYLVAHGATRYALANHSSSNPRFGIPLSF